MVSVCGGVTITAVSVDETILRPGGNVTFVYIALISKLFILPSFGIILRGGGGEVGIVGNSVQEPNSGKVDYISETVVLQRQLSQNGSVKGRLDWASRSERWEFLRTSNSVNGVYFYV